MVVSMHFNLQPLCICKSELVQGFVPVYRLVRDPNCPVHKGLLLQHVHSNACACYEDGFGNTIRQVYDESVAMHDAALDGRALPMTRTQLDGQRHRITEQDLIEARDKMWRQGFKP